MATMESGQSLEALLFKATNPSNKLEDVNTIKQFCDAVNANVGGEAAVVACRLLAHKIQSPQEREALQALAVLEACVKSCGPVFHAEVGKFKFLNEMIKLISPKYLASRTPEHIKKKVIELLYIWSTKELKGETKISEAYDMLKKQGIVAEDPAYVGEAVFASALPLRKAAPLSAEQTQKLRTLLQSKNPEDLQLANKIIKGMVQEDERKMDVLSKRATELIMVNNNAKLLGEMLDHFDKESAETEEKQLLHELFQSCEKMQPKLFRLAADTEEDDESTLAKILQASDDINRVIDRYKMVVVQGKPDILKHCANNLTHAETLLDLDVLAPPPTKLSLLDDDLLGLAIGGSPNETETLAEPEAKAEPLSEKTEAQSIEDLLSNDSAPGCPPLSLTPLSTNNSTSPGKTVSIDPGKASRQRGLDELDLLGENLLKQHLPDKKSPQFERKKEEKLSLSLLQQKQKEKALVVAQPPEPTKVKNEEPQKPFTKEEAIQPKEEPKGSPKQKEIQEQNGSNGHSSTTPEEVKLADLTVPLASIKPGRVPPLTLQQVDDGISIVLHFGKDPPREHVTAIVVTVINKLPDDISDYELKAVVPKGCKVKLQPPTTTSLPAHNPFVPPSAITQVMLIANPLKKEVSLKYILSYSTDGEPQTEMGQVDKLPI